MRLYTSRTRLYRIAGYGLKISAEKRYFDDEVTDQYTEQRQKK